MYVKRGIKLNPIRHGLFNIVSLLARLLAMFKKVHECSRWYKKVQEGSSRFKMVKEISKRFKMVQEGLRGFKNKW